jgi:hypothetical protein
VRTQERYLLSLTVTFAVTNSALAFYDKAGLDLYVSFFIVEYFALTLLHSPLHPKTQKITGSLNYVLFSIFLLIVALKIFGILGAGDA